MPEPGQGGRIMIYGGGYGFSGDISTNLEIENNKKTTTKTQIYLDST